MSGLFLLVAYVCAFLISTFYFSFLANLRSPHIGERARCCLTRFSIADTQPRTTLVVHAPVYGSWKLGAGSWELTTDRPQTISYKLWTTGDNSLSLLTSVLRPR